MLRFKVYRTKHTHTQQIKSGNLKTPATAHSQRMQMEPISSFLSPAWRTELILTRLAQAYSMTRLLLFVLPFIFG